MADQASARDKAGAAWCPMVDLSPQKRAELVELAGILAAGLQRLLERKSSRLSRCNEENPLDCAAIIDGHVLQNGKELTP